MAVVVAAATPAGAQSLTSVSKIRSTTVSVRFVPPHVPGSTAVSWLPSCNGFGGVIVGGPGETGGASATAAVDAEVASVLPAPFVAVSTTLIVWPTSAAPNG